MRTLGRFGLLLLAILALASPPALAEDQDLTGLWRGTYHYLERAEGVAKFIGFTMLVLHRGNEVTGLITESNTFGAETSPNLHATFKGRFNQNSRELIFTKTYDGTGQIEHVVQYRGQLGEDGTSGSGKWQIRADWGGEFKLEKIPQTGSGPVAGLWTGQFHYPEGVDRDPVRFSMYVVHHGNRVAGFIKESKTFGEGEDPWLHASVHGKISPETGEVSWLKSYDGTGKIWHDVEYTGRFVEAGQAINGRWEVNPKWGGRFTLRKSVLP